MSGIRLDIATVILAAKGGLVTDITVGDCLELLQTIGQLGGGKTTSPYFYQLLHSIGVFPEAAPPTVRAFGTTGQLTPGQLIDRYGIACRPVRDLLVDYLTERQPWWTTSPCNGLPPCSASGPQHQPTRRAEINAIIDRTAHQPTSTGLEPVTGLTEPRHRFLAYAFPSRSPGPSHPAVLGRPDFVAAPPASHRPRIRLPPASPSRDDDLAAKSLTSRLDMMAHRFPGMTMTTLGSHTDDPHLLVTIEERDQESEELADLWTSNG